MSEDVEFARKFVEEYMFPRDIRQCISFEVGDEYFEDELSACILDAIRAWVNRND